MDRDARASFPPLALCHTGIQLSSRQSGNNRSVCETDKLSYTQQVQRHTKADVSKMLSASRRSSRHKCNDDGASVTRPLRQNTRRHKRPAITHRLVGLVSLSWHRSELMCACACVHVCMPVSCVSKAVKEPCNRLSNICHYTEKSLSLSAHSTAKHGDRNTHTLVKRL